MFFFSLIICTVSVDFKFSTRGSTNKNLPEFFVKASSTYFFG